ncbi:hypothetical protein [Actinomadura rudentiformis]|uniref:Uncharacterized protein n=1 Tax=Actinomadura rudentiformis TaxID=359158 RepID=A0A6H9YE67_9ACTN|nr:hypothetical protein [Actinomadura rudentiformis]KAB2339516.1 hypothetical protein F8566_48100 [Actinomadura rudentiformis]
MKGHVIGMDEHKKESLAHEPTGPHSQRIDDTPGSAGSPTEASMPKAEDNPAERSYGQGSALPSDDTGIRDGSARDGEQSRGHDREERPEGRSGEGRGAAEDVPGSRPQGDELSGEDLAFEFEPGPTPQRRSKGQQGPAEGPQVEPEDS